MTIKHTPVFDKNYDALYDEDIRFIINQGGSRSSKTWSLCQLMLVHALTTPNIVISVIRKSFPALRATVMRDFLDIMRDLNIYDKNRHHQTNNEYHFPNGTIVEFFSADDEQKLRGRRRDILWANESNELSFEEYTQLNMRTKSKLIFDFNPSDNFHWLYDLISRPNALLIHSTYKDNPFLDKAQVEEIEYLINVDESYYKIYALGEKGTGKSTIYTHWKYIDAFPTTTETYYGLDFGFNHPTALIEINVVDNKAYCREVIYQTGLTSADLIMLMEIARVPKRKEIICDSARPEIIEDLKRAGYLAKSAIKDVKDGIDSVKSTELFIHKESLNLIKEIGAYKWKTQGDRIIDEPVKVYDDAVDALRYAIHWWKSKGKKKTFRGAAIYRPDDFGDDW